MKTPPMGGELFHEDRRTDMMLMIVFPNFGKAHKTTTTIIIALAQKGQFYIFSKENFHYLVRYKCLPYNPLLSPAEPRPVYLTTIWLLSFRFDLKLQCYRFNSFALCRTFEFTSYVLTWLSYSTDIIFLDFTRCSFLNVPPFAARISRVVADVQAPGGESGNV